MLVACLAGEVVAEAPAPPPGRWRCYQPPAYTVTAWFDLEPGRVRVNGGEPQRYSLDAKKGLIRWSGDAFSPNRFGRYFAPGASGGDAQRHTIVLTKVDKGGAGTSGWDRLERCYLTTH